MNGEVRSLSVSPRSSAVMFGTQVGGVWRSTNGGATTANWKKLRQAKRRPNAGTQAHKRSG
jgi:hypothetical protein